MTGIGGGLSSTWKYHNPVEIVMGSGVLDELPRFLSEGKVLLVTTPGFTKRGLTESIIRLVGERELTVLDNVKPNPTIDELENDSQQLFNEGIRQIVAVGGGSAIDSAKVLSFLLAAGDGFSLRNHFELGDILPEIIPLPLVAVPTTAGTGSEVTPFATVWDMEGEKKYSLVSARLFARIALLDPVLTMSLPEELTIVTGLDALSHALESLWNRNANPMTRLYALRAIALILTALPALAAELENAGHRTKMMKASLLAGLAISGSRTALAHSISYPITARYGMPHGLACSFTLPAILEYNAAADDGRLLETARALGFASVASLSEGLVEMYRKLNVEKMVGQYVKASEELFELVPKMFTPGRADNNLRKVTPKQIHSILQTSLAK